jgi:hypothetical protein
MSVSEPGETTPVTEPALVEEIHATPDPILRAIVGWTTQDESLEMGLTLHVAGVVVSGILVSAARFFDALAEWLKSEGAEGWAESFAGPMAEMFREPDPNAAEVSFVHLLNARVFTSGTDKPLPEALWRGRLSEVSGWSVGLLGVG